MENLYNENQKGNLSNEPLDKIKGMKEMLGISNDSEYVYGRIATINDSYFHVTPYRGKENPLKYAYNIYALKANNAIKNPEINWYVKGKLGQAEKGLLITDAVKLSEEEWNKYFEDKKMVNELTETISNLEGKSDEAKEKLDEINKSISEAKGKLDKINEDIKDAKNMYEYYKSLGIIKDKTDYSPNEIIENCDYEMLINQIWTYLWNEKGFCYKHAIIKGFMNALRTKQLILLWGRPGTGKTSLVKNISRALGAEFTCIQVQSNWTDKQDLLGFYNVVDKRYVSTPFLNAIIEAKNNPQKIHIILLDEMNLSNIEYYFSEMLNVFTWDEEYEISLYSSNAFDKLEKHRKAKEKLENDTVSEQERIELEKLILSKEEEMELAARVEYEPTITIPSNVRFIGTLNTDATTKTISPKVIDRSCLIELQTMSKEAREAEMEEMEETEYLNDYYNESAEDRSIVIGSDVIGASVIEVKELKDTQKELIDKIEEYFGKMKIHLSNRINSYIKQWTGRKDTPVDLDEIILEKVLPIIYFEYNDDIKRNFDDLIKELDKENCTNSIDKLNRMMELAKSTDSLKYWED